MVERPSEQVNCIELCKMGLSAVSATHKEACHVNDPNARDHFGWSGSRNARRREDRAAGQLHLRYYDGLSIEQAAEALGISCATGPLPGPGCTVTPTHTR
jgi:hypothetical protein